MKNSQTSIILVGLLGNTICKCEANTTSVAGLDQLPYGNWVKVSLGRKRLIDGKSIWEAS